MAHECPDCGQMCYCGGDIEDCCNNYDRYVMRCNHYKQCETDNDEDDIFTDAEYNELEEKSQAKL